jgi:hypothetical protein
MLKLIVAEMYFTGISTKTNITYRWNEIPLGTVKKLMGQLIVLSKPLFHSSLWS